MESVVRWTLGDSLTIGARYEDDYRRTAGGWRISQRTIVPIWTEGRGQIRQ